MKELSEKINKIMLFILFMACIVLTGARTLVNSYNSYKRALEQDERIEAWNLDYDIDSNMRVNVPGKMVYINLQGFVASKLGQVKYNNVIRLNNNYLTTTQDKFSEYIIGRVQEKLVSISNVADEEGAEFVFILTPMKICTFDSMLPEGIEDYTGENEVEVIKMLDSTGIDYIDIEAELHNDNMNHYDMFFKTDHHWTPEAGFWTYRYLANYMKNKYGIEVDELALDINNYNICNYPKFHLGSLGQRVGRYFWTDADDISKIVPNYDIIEEATLIKDVTSGSSGTFEDVLFDTSVLETKDYSQRLVYDNLYGKVMGHHIHNDNAVNDKVLLIETDSMGKVVVPYLSLLFSDVYWESVTEERIKDLNPDIVIVMIYPQVIPYYNN